MAFGASYPRRPRPLPPRDQWQMSLPIPDHGDLRDQPTPPGMAIYSDPVRRPRRSLAWRLQRPTSRWPGYVVPSVDHGPEIAAEAVTAPAPGRPEETDLATLRRHLEQLEGPPLSTVLGIWPPPRSPVDPGPHEEEPPTTRWRWWQRTWTRWRSRDRKPED